jgi:hypothetical protein
MARAARGPRENRNRPAIEYGNLAAVPLVENNNHLGSVLLFEDCARAANLARDFATLKEQKSPRGRDRN